VGIFGFYCELIGNLDVDHVTVLSQLALSVVGWAKYLCGAPAAYLTVTFNLLKPSGNFTYVPPGLTLKNSTWCSHCVYVFCVDLRTNSNFCLIKHQETGFYNRSGECLQRGTY
jgi:hypothetical protein